MSVDTNTRGKNLEPYHRAGTDTDLEVLVAPRLFELATRMYIAVTGAVFQRLTVQLS